MSAIHIVGVGPGDPGLITIKAARLIEAAGMVAYPTTEDGAARARDIADAHVHAEHIELGFAVPMNTERGPAQAAYDAACARISEAVTSGIAVVVLCEGDPFFYGSAMYLYARLSARHQVNVVPGVCSLMASAAALGRPLAARNEILKVLPAPLPAEILERELDACESAAIIKVGRHFDKVRDVLRRTGLEAGAAIVESASAADQRVTALNGMADGDRPYFSTILVYRGAEAWQ